MAEDDRREGVGWVRDEAVWKVGGRDGFLPLETFEQLPKRIQIVVWDDSCHR